MNIEVLKYLVENRPEIIEESSEEQKLDFDASKGIAKLLISKVGDLKGLSAKQLHHYELVIKPLILRIPCNGVLGVEEDSCNGDGYVDEETLLLCYQDEDFMCQICRHDHEKQFHDKS